MQIYIMLDLLANGVNSETWTYQLHHTVFFFTQALLNPAFDKSFSYINPNLALFLLSPQSLTVILTDLFYHFFFENGILILKTIVVKFVFFTWNTPDCWLKNGKAGT